MNEYKVRSFSLQALAFRGEEVELPRLRLRGLDHPPFPQESSTFRSTPLYVFYQSTDARGANLPNHPFFTNHSQKKRIIDGHITHFMNHLEIHHHDLNTIHLETNPITES